jgi:hypothetical protein
MMVTLGGKHRVILDSVFADPVRSSVLWSAVEPMLAACAAKIWEVRGSLLRQWGVRAVFSFHPKGHLSGKTAVKVDPALHRAVLATARCSGVTPDEWTLRALARATA